MKGNCHYQLGELDEAIRCYDETIRIHRGYPKALYNKVLALAENGRHEEAVRFYDECLAMNHGVAVVITNKAVAPAHLGR